MGLGGGLHRIEVDRLHAIEFQHARFGTFAPVNVSVDTLDDLGAGLATLADTSGVQDGGTLTVNGVLLGTYDYRVVVGNTTISSFTSTDWFSTAADSKAAVIVVVGNLTINSGQTVIPSTRKLFTLIYVTGTLTVTGGISMSARGANHSVSGSSLSAGAIRIINGTHGSVSNPEVPAAGASGGTAVSTSAVGNAGSAGTAGQTGGGGSGGRGSGSTSGAGAAGTGFSGGSGGSGAGFIANGEAGQANGGEGGDAPGGEDAGGGAGNPGGTGEVAGTDGTGGVLIVICGTLAGAGTIVANGSAGGGASGTGSTGGGGSGGGSVTVLYGTDSSSITPTATGGAGGDATGTNSRDGGAGGNGTARKLQRAA